MTWYPTRSHYPDTEPTSPCPILIMPSTWLGSDKYQFYKSLIWLDHGFNPTIFQTRGPCSTDSATMPDNLYSVHSSFGCVTYLQDTVCIRTLYTLYVHTTAPPYRQTSSQTTHSVQTLVSIYFVLLMHSAHQATFRQIVPIRANISFLVLFNDASRARWFPYHRLLDVKHMVILTYLFRGNPLSPPRLLFPCRFLHIHRHVESRDAFAHL